MKFFWTTGCRIEVESPQRSEDLKRKAETTAYICTTDDRPKFFFTHNHLHLRLLVRVIFFVRVWQSVLCLADRYNGCRCLRRFFLCPVQMLCGFLEIMLVNQPFRVALPKIKTFFKNKKATR